MVSSDTVEISGPGAIDGDIGLGTGSYVISAIVNPSSYDTDDQAADCRLSTGAAALVRMFPGRAQGGISQLNGIVIPLQDVTVVSGYKDVTVRCHTYLGHASATIIATKVGAVHR